VEGYHLEGGSRSLIALVAERAARAVFGLLEVVGGEHAEDDGLIVLDVEFGDALRNAVADKIKMPCVALNDAAKDDYGVHVGVFEEALCAEREFKCAWHAYGYDVFLLHIVFYEGVVRTFEERVCDFLVPLRNDDADFHVDAVWNLRRPEVGKVFEV